MSLCAHGAPISPGRGSVPGRRSGRGWSTTRRTPSRTPGMKRAAVHRVVADGEGLALAAEQDLLVGDEPAQPYRVHRHPVDVRAARAVQGGAGGVRLRRRSRPRARASAMSWAVRTAVPLGASALFGWCSSMTSTDSKKRAACWAKRMVSTAPMPKFGAMSTPVPGEASSQSRSCAGARRSSRWCRRRRGCRGVRRSSRLPMTDVRVRSARRRPGRRPRPAASSLSPRPSAATSSMSSAASTARTASEPIRPWAPRTATRSLLIVLFLRTSSRLRAGRAADGGSGDGLVQRGPPAGR